MERHHQEKMELDKERIELERKRNLEDEEERRGTDFYRHFKMTK
jgi:hypothetical protein